MLRFIVGFNLYNEKSEFINGCKSLLRNRLCFMTDFVTQI